MKKDERETYQKTWDLFDGKCAICGSTKIAMHHIRYGACGRKTYMGNIIPLCDIHHRLVHSNKKKYQPELIKIVNEKMRSE